MDSTVNPFMPGRSRPSGAVQAQRLSEWTFAGTALFKLDAW